MEREEITYPLGNSDFLRVLTNSFKEFIEKGTSRSIIRKSKFPKNPKRSV